MPRRRSHFQDVLKFWQSVETFALPDLPNPNRLGPGKEMYTLEPGELLPWEDAEFPDPAEGKQWRHTFYFYIVEKEAVMQLLEEYAPGLPTSSGTP